MWVGRGWQRFSAVEKNAMSWVLEEPIPIIFVGLVTVAILFGGLVQTGKKPILYLMLAAVVFFATLLVVEQLVVTTREQVENTVYAIARDAETNDAITVVRHVSSANKSLRGTVRSHMNLVVIEQVKVKGDLTVELHPGQDPPTATAKFHAVVIGSDHSGQVRHQRFPRVFVVEFVYEDDAWRVYDYEIRIPGGGL
jgi:hypothetical protein